MSKKTIGVILMIGIIAGIVMMGMSLFGGFGSGEVEDNTIVQRHSNKTCNHDWDVAAENGQIYCLECSIQEVLR